MFSLTHAERKVLLFIAILILCGATLKFFKVRLYGQPEQAYDQVYSGKAVLIDINTASQEELEIIPGIGPELANRILEYRVQNGQFQTLQDLHKVKGIGDKKLQAIKDYITF